MKRILIVDDEQDICKILSFNLNNAGYETDTASSGKEAIEKLRTTDFDLVLLDVMMPGMSGFEVARQLGGRLPIIFLTAHDGEEDVLHGFSLSADDYIAKPFSVREVLARIRAVLNRTSEPETKAISYKKLTISLENKMVSVNGKNTSCTRTEFEILYLLLTHPGQVFSRQELIERVWPRDVIVTNRTIDVNMTRIRRKLGPYAANIVTRQGYGYCFEDR